MTIPHTNQGRKAFLAKLNEKRFRKKTKDGKTGPWMERKLEFFELAKMAKKYVEKFFTGFEDVFFSVFAWALAPSEAS